MGGMCCPVSGQASARSLLLGRKIRGLSFAVALTQGKAPHMEKKHRDPGEGEGAGTQGEARQGSPRGLPRWTAAGSLVLLALVLQAGCATSTPLGGRMRGSSFRHRPR